MVGNVTEHSHWSAICTQNESCMTVVAPCESTNIHCGLVPRPMQPSGWGKASYRKEGKALQLYR